MLARRRVQRVRRQGACGLLGAALFGISAEETRPTTSYNSYVAPVAPNWQQLPPEARKNVGAPIILECLLTLSRFWDKQLAQSVGARTWLPSFA